MTETSRRAERVAGSATLFFLCGKMASGKSTLAQELAARENALLLGEDELLSALYPGEVVDVPTYAKYSSRIRNALTPLICTVLSEGLSIVLDFPANTRNQRVWFRGLSEASAVGHELHFIDAPDSVCKRQLRERSQALPEGTRWTSDVEFDTITAYFEPPSAEEGFTVVVHRRS